MDWKKDIKEIKSQYRSYIPDLSHIDIFDKNESLENFIFWHKHKDLQKLKFLIFGVMKKET
jgi:hypothetical protein